MSKGKSDFEQAEIGRGEVLARARAKAAGALAGLDAVEYADSDGNGQLEAFLHFHGSESTAGSDFSVVEVLESGAGCAPRHLDSLHVGPGGSIAIDKQRLVVQQNLYAPDDAMCGPSGTQSASYRLVDGKLPEAR